MILLSKTFGAAIALMMTPVADKPIDIVVLDSIVGQDSLRTTSGAELARTQEEWTRVWNAHRGVTEPSPNVVTDSPPPAVDFKKAMVLAVFSGESPSMLEVKILGTKDYVDRAVIRMETTEFPRSSVRLQTRSFGIFMLTAYRKAVEIQVMHAGEWKTVAKFPKLPAAKK